VTNEYRAVDADRPLSDICSLVGRNSVPLGVTDADGRLVGVVPRATLLAALATPVTNHSADNGAGKDNGNA
jgi:glycine betaine/proline transport system ATP-binding protein